MSTIWLLKIMVDGEIPIFIGNSIRDIQLY